MIRKAVLGTVLAAVCGAAFAALPNVAVYATGGTIAGQSAASDKTNYSAAKVGVDKLVQAVPELANIANVTSDQVAQIGSQDMSDAVWLTLAKKINAECGKKDGFVITHGTDTMEETAYFLNLVTKSDKPVILVGAMRPATAISADGPMNLLEAVRVASTPEAKGKGVMIVMNDEINGARDVTKTNTTNPATFKSPELGAMGYVSGNKVRFYKQSTKRHTTNSEFDVSKLDTLPRVDIIYSHVDDDRVMADAAVVAGAKGIIHAGTGNGSIANPTMEGLKDAVAKGVVVVRSARVPNGATTVSLPMWTKAGFLESDTLNPQKARLLLQLALTKTQDPKEIQRMFDQY